MIVDCHGHYTTAPNGLKTFRQLQIEALEDPSRNPAKHSIKISDDEIRESLEGAQLKLQRDRGIDVTLFSPIAGQMAHHIGNAVTSQVWSAGLQRSDLPGHCSSTPITLSACASCPSRAAFRRRASFPSSSAASTSWGSWAATSTRIHPAGIGRTCR